MQVTTSDVPTQNNKSMTIYLVIAIALVITVAGTYFYTSTNPVSPQPITAVEPSDELTTDTPPVIAEQAGTTVDQPPVPPQLSEPVIIEPVVNAPPAKLLPSLDDSDPLALESAQQLSWLSSYGAMLNTKDIIRNFVTFIDNLARNELAAKFSPLIKPTAKFSVIERDGELYLDPDSYQRFDIYVDIINSINVEFALDLYGTLKPLFEAAYQELGYPADAFDSTLDQALENALMAPIIREKIQLVAPSVMYKFSDPTLEQLPAAHKLMIRMGPQNMIKLRPKLQQIQAALLAN